MIYVRRGDTWQATVTLADANGAPLSLAGYTATATARTPSGVVLSTVTAVVGATSIALTASTSTWPDSVPVEIHVTYTTGSTTSTVYPPIEVTALRGDPHTALVVPTSAVYEARGRAIPAGPATLIGRGQTAQGGSGTSGALLLEMPIAVASVAATPSWGRTDADTPAAPAGNALVDVVADPTMASRDCLRCGVDGGAGAGLWLYAVQDVTLPADGWILEVDIADLPDASVAQAFAAISIMHDDYDEGGAETTPRGLVCLVYRGAANIDLSSWEMLSTDYTAQVIRSGFDGGVLHDQALIDAGGLVLRFECRREASVTPTEWLIRCEVRDQSGAVYHSSKSGVSLPITDLDGRALASIGLGGYVRTSGGPAGDAWISVRRVRVWSL